MKAFHIHGGRSRLSSLKDTSCSFQEYSLSLGDLIRVDIKAVGEFSHGLFALDGG
jgi:hypothetical protein